MQLHLVGGLDDRGETSMARFSQNRSLKVAFFVCLFIQYHRPTYLFIALKLLSLVNEAAALAL